MREGEALPARAEPVVEAMDLELELPAPAVGQGLGLTKFRREPDADPEPAGASAAANEGGNQLGRIPIVRMRKGRDPSKPSHVARLLASF